MASSNDFVVYQDENPLEKSCSNFANLRKREDFKDLEILVKNGGPVVAQKIVLAARIPFLCDLVSGSPLRWDREDVDAECAESIVSYAYTGKLKVTRENVANVVSLSKILKLDHIVNCCIDFIIERLDLNNLPIFWTLSDENDLVTLKTSCLNLMRVHFESFVSSSLFIQLDFGVFKSLISSDDLNVSKEESVFGAIKTWIQGDNQVARENDLDELLRCIRWSEKNTEFRKRLAANEEIVKKRYPCIAYLLSVEHNISYPKGLFNPIPRNSQQIIIMFGEPSSGESEWIAESFDPATERSITLAHLTYREQAAVVSVGRGKVMILGGSVDGKISSSVELFFCSEKKSRPVASLNVARMMHGACAVGEDVVVCGGSDEEWNDLNSCEVYSQGSWRHLPAMNETRWGIAVVSSSDRRVFTIGGCKGKERACLSTVEVCRLPADFSSSPPTEDFWRKLAPMRKARKGPAAQLVEGNLLVAGGWTGSENLSSIEMFSIDQEEAQWVSLSASMKEKRCYFSLVVSFRGIFAFGNYEDPCNSVERLNVLTNSNKVEASALEAVIMESSAAQWESLPPITSMERVHRAVLSSNSWL